MIDKTPHISLIIPILNEAAELPGLFANLADQTGIYFEVILCDGSSRDKSRQLSQQLAGEAPFPVKVIMAPPGRGVQMNTGADNAASELLLFIHADSRFCRSDALQYSVAAYYEQAKKFGEPIAARFSLSFRRSCSQPSLAYFFYESKTRLDRADCIRGDQGFMIFRAAFNALGRFDQSLPFLEDVQMAATVAQHARWLLLPAEISTSARRFETEGLYQRQVANAIMINALETGWLDMLSALPHLYRCQHLTGKLQLFPLLDGVRSLIAAQPAQWRHDFWRTTGRHAARNIWQLFFWLDVRACFKSCGPTANLSAPRLQWFQRNMEHLTAWQLVEIVTTVAVWIWFRGLMLRYRLTTGTS